jgi:hypothetical protein
LFESAEPSLKYPSGIPPAPPSTSQNPFGSGIGEYGSSSSTANSNNNNNGNNNYVSNFREEDEEEYAGV